MFKNSINSLFLIFTPLSIYAMEEFNEPTFTVSCNGTRENHHYSVYLNHQGNFYLDSTKDLEDPLYFGEALDFRIRVALCPYKGLDFIETQCDRLTKLSLPIAEYSITAPIYSPDYKGPRNLREISVISTYISFSVQPVNEEQPLVESQFLGGAELSLSQPELIYNIGVHFLGIDERTLPVVNFTLNNLKDEPVLPTRAFLHKKDCSVVYDYRSRQYIWSVNAG